MAANYKEKYYAIGHDAVGVLYNVRNGMEQDVMEELRAVTWDTAEGRRGLDRPGDKRGAGRVRGGSYTARQGMGGVQVDVTMGGCQVVSQLAFPV